MGLKNFHRKVLACAMLAYALAAWNSTGFHSADEHHQIIAFAQWKLGELPAAALPWEFNAGIRPSFQPWIAAGVFKAAAACGTTDPFTQAFLLRLLTALLGLAAVRAWLRASMESVEPAARKGYLTAAYLLWFLPFLFIRFSSEAWSGIFLLWAWAALLKRGARWSASAGLLAGAAMLCRPPVAVIALSCMAWMALVRKDHARQLLTFAAAALAVLAGGFLLDRAFYGRYIPTLWNLVLLGFSEPGRFDSLPWYYYPPWIFKYAIPPIGAAILVAFAVLLLKKPKHLALWCALPFLLVHSAIPHKELRFLYPLAGLVPLALVQGWSILRNAWGASAWWKYLVPPLLAVLAAVNLAGLAVTCTTPAGNGQAELAAAIRRACPTGCRVAYMVPGTEAWRIMPPPFYCSDSTEYAWLQVPQGQALPDGIDFVVVQDGDALPPPPAGHPLVPVTRTLPPWATRLMGWYTWHEGYRPWNLYRAKP